MKKAMILTAAAAIGFAAMPVNAQLLGGGGLNPQALFALQGLTTVRNVGAVPAGPYQVVFYSGARADTTRPDTKIIITVHGCCAREVQFRLESFRK